jgi:type II secretory pathway predicted ATPase ExeA
VLARLLQAIRDEQGIALLTGAAGTGKTLLCYCLLERLDAGIVTVYLTNSHFADRTALLQSILYDLDLPYQGLSEQELRLALIDRLLSTYSAGKHTLIIVDEAQNLSADLFEELRLLSNLEARQGKAVQILLVGQPDLAAMLRQPGMAALDQRIAVRTVLDPLPEQEAADYLHAQLRAAGARPDRVMGPEALQLLAQRTGGFPRLLNHAAHEAMSLACSAGAEQVDAEAALEALQVLGLDTAAEEENATLPADGDPSSGARTPVETELLRRLFPTRRHA